MTIVGFHFTNIHVHKDKAASGRINVGTNYSLKDVQETDVPMGKSKQKGLKYSFEFVASYEPEVGAIKMNGNVVAIEDEAKHAKILEGWKKNNSLEVEDMKPIMNHVVQKCYVQALVLSKDINLPPPFKLPKVTDKQQ